MRRISMALALVSAMAAGCSMSKAPGSSDSTGSAKGVPGTNYYVNLFTPPLGGVVTSNIGGINCGASSMGVPVADSHGVLQYAPVYYAGSNHCGQTLFTWAQSVILTAAPQGANVFIGWAGDCKGIGTCTLTPGADKTVVAIFAAAGTAHPDYMDPAVHGAAYLKFNAGTAGALDCTTCHGETLGGQGIAPSCASCHTWPLAPHMIATGHNSGACARCHSGAGFRDYIGADGTASNVAALTYYPSTAATALGTDFVSTSTSPFVNGMDCNMCHNSATVLGGGSLNSHVFAGIGAAVTLDGKSAICAQCHDGARPGYEVATLKGVIAAAAVATDDTLMASGQKTQRAHYLPAAAALLGAEAAGFYQYPGATYTRRNQHGGLAACTDCHSAHTGALPADTEIQAKCGACHEKETGGQVASFMDLEESRQFGFEGDIDGNGVQESLKIEINGLGAKLYEAIQAYALNAAPGTAICVNSNRAYIQVGTAACNVAPNTTEYAKFTPRLLRAVFNYLFFQNEAGGWAHNPRYEIEVLFDTINDLNGAIPAANRITFAGKRAFNGHFGAADAATPYAAMTDGVPYGFSAACIQCHGGAGGLTTYLGVAPAAMPATIDVANKVPAFQCATCHSFNGTDMSGIRTDITNVYFPPQKTAAATPAQKVIVVAASAMPPGNAVCASCHSARENGATIDVKIGATPATTFSLSFTNPHYLGAAAMIMGKNTAPMAQYGANSYSGNAVFWRTGTNGAAPGPHGSPHGAECNGCHQAKESKHTFAVDFTYCATCHKVQPYGDYRLAPIEEEFSLRSAELYSALRAYAVTNIAAIQTATATPAATGVCYNGNAYPYWFVEVSGACSATSFAKFSPPLLRAAYNYQWTVKEPGAWAHNEPYVTQVMFDAITDLGGTPSFTRPAVTP